MGDKEVLVSIYSGTGKKINTEYVFLNSGAVDTSSVILQPSLTTASSLPNAISNSERLVLTLGKQKRNVGNISRYFFSRNKTARRGLRVQGVLEQRPAHAPRGRPQGLDGPEGQGLGAEAVGCITEEICQTVYIAVVSYVFFYRYQMNS